MVQTGIGIMFFLFLAIWALAVGLILFFGYQTRRYHQLFCAIMARLDKMEDRFLSLDNKSKVPQETSLSIQRDEPISKYQNVTLPDDIDISFVEKDS